ncbi:MAG: DUF4184 family protein, partial [Gammaproteobacteria bacterium]|nr:DUF4184 family protein [Gammaproteobacteria bacterium]
RGEMRLPRPVCGRQTQFNAERPPTVPITPLHLGPALVLKAGTGKTMSLTVFAFSQVAMDVEVLVRIIIDADRLHGFSNTIFGASIVLFPSVLLGRPVCRAFLNWWNRNLSAKQRELLAVDPKISWLAAWSGGILGVYSHWFLDAMMHADALAVWPLARGNPFIDWLSIGEINGLCLGSLVVGLLAFGVMAGIRRIRKQVSLSNSR